MTDRIKLCPLCGAKLKKDRWGIIYKHEANDCILDYYEVYDDDLDKWNARKPMDRIVEQLEERTAFLKDCKKYGNKDAEQQNHSYSTMFMYEVADMVDDLIEIVKEGGK